MVVLLVLSGADYYLPHARIDFDPKPFWNLIYNAASPPMMVLGIDPKSNTTPIASLVEGQKWVDPW